MQKKLEFEEARLARAEAAAFKEFVKSTPNGAVLDGEILAMREASQQIKAVGRFLGRAPASFQNSKELVAQARKDAAKSQARAKRWLGDKKLGDARKRLSYLKKGW